MAQHHGKQIVEGEVSGFPVPGGWPNRGPFQVIADLFRRKRRADPSADENSKSSDDESTA